METKQIEHMKLGMIPLADDSPNWNFIGEIQCKINSELVSKYEERLKVVLKTNLGNMGHYFDTDDEFLAFCKENITRVGVVGSLDVYNYVMDDGFVVASMNENIKFNRNGNVFTVTIGE